MLECLASIFDSLPDGRTVEVIVIDNASSDDSAEAVRASFPSVVLQTNDFNAGYAQANNQAIDIARGNSILLLNPDVVLHADSLKNALSFLDANSEAAAITARLILPNGTTQLSIRGFPSALSVLAEYCKLPHIPWLGRYFDSYRLRRFNYEAISEIDQPMGSFLLIRKSAIVLVGQLDEAFPIFFNEVDWCYRAKVQKKLHIWYSPDVVVTHYGGSSTKQVKPLMIKESHESLIRFYEKHYRARLPFLAFHAFRRVVKWHERRELGSLTRSHTGRQQSNGEH